MSTRAEASAKMKTKWADCEVMAQKINEVLGQEFTKNRVHDYLYAEIAAKDWVQQVKDGNREVIAQLADLPGWDRMTEPPRPRPRIHQPRDGKERPATPFAKLKLGMWFIDMIGDAGEAMAIIKAAAGAVRQLEREES